MKFFKTLLIAVILFSFNSRTQAQDSEKLYSFAVYQSNGTADSDCLEIKKAYISPIVSYQFDGGYYKSTLESMLASRWEDKCKARFDIEYTFCWGDYAAVWEDSFSEADKKRDKEIYRIRQNGYTIIQNYGFGFSFDPE